MTIRLESTGQTPDYIRLNNVSNQLQVTRESAGLLWGTRRDLCATCVRPSLQYLSHQSASKEFTDWRSRSTHSLILTHKWTLSVTLLRQELKSPVNDRLTCTCQSGTVLIHKWCRFQVQTVIFPNVWCKHWIFPIISFDQTFGKILLVFMLWYLTH